MCKWHVWLTINQNIIKIVIRQSATHRSCSFCGKGVVKTDFVFLEIENCDTKMINDSKQGAAVAQEVCQSVCTVWMVSVPDEHCKLCHQCINGWMLTWVACLEYSSFYYTVYIYIHIYISFHIMQPYLNVSSLHQARQPHTHPLSHVDTCIFFHGRGQAPPHFAQWHLGLFLFHSSSAAFGARPPFYIFTCWTFDQGPLVWH